MNSMKLQLYTYMEAGDVSSGDGNGIGDTHISSNGIFPALSIKPGVDVLLGSAAKIGCLRNVQWRKRQYKHGLNEISIL